MMKEGLQVMARLTLGEEELINLDNLIAEYGRIE
jgi:hypothetical protein